MKRPLCVMGVALALAVRAAFSFPQEEILLLSLAAGSAGFVCLLLRKRRKLRPVALACLAAGMGFAVCWLHQEWRAEPFHRARGQVVAMEGVVEEASFTSSSSVRYRVKAAFPGRKDLPDGQRIVVRAYGEMEFLPGDLIRGAVRLESPWSASTASFYRTRGIRSEAVAGGGGLERFSGGLYRWDRLVIRVRSMLQANLEGNLTEETAGVLAAMVLGERGNVPSEVYTHLERSGAVHLLSISGLHLSVFTGFVIRLLGALGLRRRRAAGAALVADLLFVALVGATASITRAYVMTAMMLVAEIISRHNDSINSLGLSLLLISCIWPQWTLGRGLWLSCAGTLGILVLGDRVGTALANRLGVAEGKRPLIRWARWLVKAAGIAVAAYLFTLPLLVAYNGWVSLLAPVVSIAIAPLITPMIVGGILCALLPPSAGGPVAWVTEISTRLTLWIAKTASGLPFATTSLDQFWKLLWLFLVAGMLLILWRSRDRRLIAWSAVLCMLVYGAGELSLIAANRARVELAVVEHCGAAVLLRNGEAVVVGTPDPYEIDRLLDYLSFRNVREVTALVAMDSGDQVGSGLLRLHGEYPLACVIGPNDDYVLGQIATALPSVPVYSGGYARTLVLGGVILELDLPTGGVYMETGGVTLLKTGPGYGIMEAVDAHIVIHEGEILSPWWNPVVEPVGAALYGECRLVLPVAKEQS